MKQTAALEVGLSVIDLERMCDFYCQSLSCVELRRSDIPAALSSGLTVAEQGYRNLWLQTPFGEVIKLMSPPVAPTPAPTAPMLTALAGLRYLTFYCESIEEVLARAEGCGAKLRSDRQLLSGDVGVKLCFFEDPEGNVIELVESL